MDSYVPSIPVGLFDQSQSYVPSIYGAPRSFSQSTPYFGDNNMSWDQYVSANKGQNLAGLWDQYQNIQSSGQATGQDGLTVIGQGSAWLSPDELRAKTDALGKFTSSLGPGETNGNMGAGGGAGAPTTTSSSGGLLSGAGGTGQQLSGPNISGFPNFTGSGGVGNFLPNGQVAGGQGPGGYMPGTGQGNGQVGGQVAMSQSSPQNALNQFYNTAGYQLTEGPGAAQQFQQSPGYQYAVNEALKQVQQNAASRGLLDSGAALRGMTDRAQGMAMQDFGNWQNRQQQLFGSYQNRLAGLMGGPTGADQAYGVGQGMAGTSMQAGGDIASLLANQGNSLFGGIVGTGAAQANNINQAGNMQAQILAGNQATRLAAGLF